MTLNDRQNQARNLIMQQVQVLLEELNTQANTIGKLQQYNKEYETSYKNLKSNPDIGSEGWYQKRLSESYSQTVTLREDLKKWKEFGKLKDRAKIKVEQARDTYKAQAEYWQEKAEQWKHRAFNGDVDELREQNDRQALAYEDMRRQNSDLMRQNNLLKEKVTKLNEVVSAGVEGLRAEDTRRRNTQEYW